MLNIQVSPRLATQITTTCFVKAFSSYNLFYYAEKDELIFLKTKELGNVFILTKDKDFAELQARLLIPPKIIFLKTGNCSNEKMKRILSECLLFALEELINTSTEIVEIKPKNIL